MESVGLPMMMAEQSPTGTATVSDPMQSNDAWQQYMRTQQQQQQQPTFPTPPPAQTPMVVQGSQVFNIAAAGGSGSLLGGSGSLFGSQADVESGMQLPPPVATGVSGPAGSQAAYQQLMQMVMEMRNELAALRALTHPPGGTQPALVGPSALPVHRNLFNVFQAADEIDLKDIDKKDVAPPGKYRGDAAAWRHWFRMFTTFLTRRDARWGTLLDAIRKHSTNP